MKQGLFEGAIDCYTRAIQLDGRNAVYYCNRYFNGVIYGGLNISIFF